MGLFGVAHRWCWGLKRLLSLKSGTHPTMVKPATIMAYLKKIKKFYKSRDTTLEFYWNQHFYTGNLHKRYTSVNISMVLRWGHYIFCLCQVPSSLFLNSSYSTYKLLSNNKPERQWLWYMTSHSDHWIYVKI